MERDDSRSALATLRRHGAPADANSKEMDDANRGVVSSSS